MEGFDLSTKYNLPMTKYEAQLVKQAESGTDEESSKAMKRLRKINPTYHWCWDWDGMVIADDHMEYICCTCKK